MHTHHALVRPGKRRLESLSARITNENAPQLINGKVTLSLSRRPQPPATSNLSKEAFMEAIRATKEYIQAGDIFQLVFSQRFERRTFADPFEVYR